MPRFTIILTTMLTATAMAGCSSTSSRATTSFDATQHEPRAVVEQPQEEWRTYAYYADCEVYRNLESGMFFWQENDAWQSGPELPARFALDESKRFDIPLATDEPFRVHHSVSASFASAEP